MTTHLGSDLVSALADLEADDFTHALGSMCLKDCERRVCVCVCCDAPWPRTFISAHAHTHARTPFQRARSSCQETAKCAPSRAPQCTHPSSSKAEHTYTQAQNFQVTTKQELILQLLYPIRGVGYSYRYRRLEIVHAGWKVFTMGTAVSWGVLLTPLSASQHIKSFNSVWEFYLGTKQCFMSTTKLGS